jgi:endo-1,4-beta-xylanase
MRWGRVLVAYSEGDDCYEPVAVAECNSLAPEIATFPNRIAAVPGLYDFAEADAICDLAQRNDMRCQAHAIIWDPVDHPEWGIMPDWIAAQPPAQRRATMIAYVDAVARHFAGRVSLCTLVNEAFDSNGNVTANRWNTTGDDSYIFDAFRAARRADPTAKLFYNDFGAEDLNPKSDAILALAQRLRAETVPVEIDGVVRNVPLIDGIGMQMHDGIRPGEAPDPFSVAANIARIGQAGLLVRITEMDVRIPVDDQGQATAEDLEGQKQLYAELLAACRDAPNCNSVSF